MSNKNVASGGGSRSLLMTYMFLTAVAACGVSGYLFWEMKFAKPAAEVAQGEVQATPAPVQVEPLYASMNTFTVSLKPTPRENDRILYIGLTLRVRDEQSQQLIEKFLPEVRSRLLVLFSKQTAEELSTDDGKYQLVEAIKSVMNKPLAAEQSAIVTDVLFNAFILR